MSFKCPHCHRKYNSAPAAMAHQMEAHSNKSPSELKRKGWATPYGFMDFREPVTYEEALEESKAIAAIFTRKREGNQP